MRVGPVRDSLAGMALILALMTETSKSISELVKELPSYHIIKTKFAADKKKFQQITKKVAESFTDARLNKTDGCRFDFEDGWIHIRASNTEPVVRVIVEAKDKLIAEKYLNVVSDLRQSL